MKECPFCRTCFDDPTASCPQDGSALEASIAGSRLIDGKYQIESLLGKGGMGAVYEVRHLGLDKRFALKLILPARAIRDRFLAEFRSEARILGRLKHSNIVEVTDYGLDDRDGGTPYLVMECLEGSNLRTRLEKSGPLAIGDALHLLDQMARAIDYAHQQGVLHCDIKPANVFLQQSADPAPIVKILDFGLALLLRTPAPDGNHSRVTLQAAGSPSVHYSGGRGERVQPAQSSIYKSSLETADIETAQLVGSRGIRGTLAYMAPEIINGEEPTSASDIYSFGVLIYETLVGWAPFEITRSHLNLQPQSPPTSKIAIPREVESALLGILDGVPGRRPQNACDAVSAVRSAYALAQKRKWRAREIPRRLGLAALFAPVIAALSIAAAGIEPAQRVADWIIDVQFLAQPHKQPDSRILILNVDDAALAADQTLIGERADEFGRQLERVFAAGAKAVAIDFLLPRLWSRSAAFSQFVLRHADDVTLAAFSSPGGETIGTECLSGLTAAALGPTKLRSLFGFVNLDEDQDGVTRRARLFYPGRTGEKLDGWATHASRTLTNSPEGARILRSAPEFFRIDYTIDWQQFERISWMDLSKLLEADPSLFAGRLVLVGGDFVASGDDVHRIPAASRSRSVVSGVVLETIIVNTMLSGVPIREMRMPWGFLVPCVTCGFLVGAVLCLDRLTLILYAFGGVAVAGATLVFCLFRWAGLIFPIAGLLLVGVLALASGLVLRWRLAAFPSQDTQT